MNELGGSSTQLTPAQNNTAYQRIYIYNIRLTSPTLYLLHLYESNFNPNISG